MSGRGRNRGNRRQYNNQLSLSSVARQQASSLPSDSPVLAIFKQAAAQLTERQDRHERLVKLSRDITIESKRIIFLLHSTITRESSAQATANAKEKLKKLVKSLIMAVGLELERESSAQAITDAKERLQKLVKGPIMAVGLELEHVPAYLHSRAVTAGFQEFVEALTFCSVVEKNEIVPYRDVQELLTYEVEEGEQTRTLVTLLPHNDYMLGVADLTGELMRRAINSISSGDSQDCFLACGMLRDIYTGYLGLFGIGKDLGHKMNATRANLNKVESAMYALSVRGENPLHACALQRWGEERTQDDTDEGYY